MPKLSEIFLGTKDKVTKLPTQSPMQLELANLIKQGLTSGTGAFKELFSKFNQQDFEEGVAQPEIKRYQQEVLPNIIEKFIGRGSVNGSGFQRNVLKSGTDLASKLAELRYNAQNQQKQNQLAGINNVTGTKQFENVFQPGQEGLLSKFAGGVANSAGKATDRGINALGTAAAKWIAG